MFKDCEIIMGLGKKSRILNMMLESTLYFILDSSAGAYNLHMYVGDTWAVAVSNSLYLIW